MAQTHQPIRHLILGVLIIAAVALSLGIWVWHQQSEMTGGSMQGVDATVLPQARSISAFELIDQQGHAFTNQQLLGHWSLVFFGFTNCSMICPTTMAELNQTYQLLQKNHIDQPQVIMVSVDPERDSVAKMRDYVTAFNKNFIGLTGEKSVIEKLTRQMGVVYMKVESNNSIDHSGTVMLINPQGKLQAFFSMPHDAKKMAKDFVTIKQHVNVA